MELNQKIFNTEYLRDSTEGGMIRDFVRFVRLMDYVDINLKFDKESFTKNVLRDVPMQIINFFRIRGIQPIINY